MISDPQPDLFTPRPAGASAEAPPWLDKLLFEGKCWMTAGDIQLTTQGRVIDREIRQLASESVNIISGQRGYKHVAHATPEEINHAANWLVSQGKKMIKRGIAIRSNAHKVFG